MPSAAADLDACRGGRRSDSSGDAGRPRRLANPLRTRGRVGRDLDDLGGLVATHAAVRPRRPPPSPRLRVATGTASAPEAPELSTPSSAPESSRRGAGRVRAALARAGVAHRASALPLTAFGYGPTVDPYAVRTWAPTPGSPGVG